MSVKGTTKKNVIFRSNSSVDGAEGFSGAAAVQQPAARPRHQQLPIAGPPQSQQRASRTIQRAERLSIEIAPSMSSHPL